jgi:hypothetical protein
MPQDCKSYEGDERRTEGGSKSKFGRAKTTSHLEIGRRREGRGGHADSTRREWKEEKTSARNTGCSAETRRLAWHGQQNHLLFDESRFMGRRWGKVDTEWLQEQTLLANGRKRRIPMLILPLLSSPWGLMEMNHLTSISHLGNSWPHQTSLPDPSHF